MIEAFHFENYCSLLIQSRIPLNHLALNEEGVTFSYFWFYSGAFLKTYS